MFRRQSDMSSYAINTWYIYSMKRKKVERDFQVYNITLSEKKLRSKSMEIKRQTRRDSQICNSNHHFKNRINFKCVVK